jgi:two-component system sensor histidine kinase/response regulator
LKQGPAYKILIVDDTQSNLFTLRSLIERHIDAEIIEADSGKGALQQLTYHSVDLIILDVNMKDMDGFEVAALIKQRKKTKDIPIVFLTASYLGDGFKKRGFEVGAVDYLTKPIDENQLISRINVYLKLIEKERTMDLQLEKKVEEQTRELIRAMVEAEKANEAKSIFLANVSHELRTPLSILLSTTQMLKIHIKNNSNKIDLQFLKKQLDMQTQNCYRLLRLVNNLIDITKMDTGNFSLNKKRLDIIRIIKSIVLSIEEYMHTKSLNLEFQTNTDSLIMSFDPDSIERILLNLLSNAIKFTPSGGTIRVKAAVDGILRISVSDNGIGISPEQQETIFERFKQVDGILTRRYEGSGIGLSLVKQLAEMHGGTIGLKSEKGKGSEFIVELPIDAGEKSDTDEHSALYKDMNSVVQTINIEFSDIYF